MTKNEWLDVARTVLASRMIDEIEEVELVPAGKVTYQFSAKGHELVQAILGHRLTQGHDAATVYYRSRPFVIAAGMTFEQAFAGPLANQGSRSGGRDIGVVHHLPNVNGVAVLPASGDVGAQYTPCVGWAQSIMYHVEVLKNPEWKGAIAVALGGDGSTATNGFWAALNIATTQNLPMMFFIEDNGWGISVPSEFQTPGSNIAQNLASFSNLRIVDIDGTNPDEADRMISKSISHVREGKSPALVRVRVPRICGHSGADNQSYKSDEQKAEDAQRDPVVHLREYLIKKGYFNEGSWIEFSKDVEVEVREGCSAALSHPEPDESLVFLHKFYDGKAPFHGGLLAENLSMPEGSEELNENGPRINLIEAVKRTLEKELEINDRLLVFGEDVGVKGGVHGATVDLQIKFGERRVFDTSLSEEGIIGRAVGMAYAGLMPVPEIQFRKYLDPAMEQINDGGTIRWRTNGDFGAPMVVRIPVGFSKRTGDPWHSVSGESIFAHTIGWKIIMPSNAQDAVGLLRTALRGQDPTFFLEHRAIQDTSPGRGVYPGDEYVIPLGNARIVRAGSKITIVTWGEMVHRVSSLVESEGFDAEIVDLRTIVPWDREAVLLSVKKTGRCLIVHEDGLTCGFGAEISATVTSEAFQFLDAPVMRLAPADVPIPYNRALMEVVIPSAKVISEKIRSILSF